MALIRATSGSGGGGGVPLSSVPTLTSDYSPQGGMAFSFPYHNNSYPTWYAFDGDDNTYAYVKAETSGTENYIGYHFDVPTCIKTVTLVPYTIHSANTVTLKIQAFDIDNVTWVDLYTDTSWSRTKQLTFSLNNTNSYNTYRLWLSNGMNKYDSYTYTSIKSLQFLA